MDGIFLRICYIAVGGALGSVARYLINISPVQGLSEKFPYPTFLVNILGSFLMGFLLILFTEKFSISDNLKLAVLVGFLGAFTTFSTFELEIWELVNENRYIIAFAYLFLSVAFGFVGVILGMSLARKM